MSNHPSSHGSGDHADSNHTHQSWFHRNAITVMGIVFAGLLALVITAQVAC